MSDVQFRAEQAQRLLEDPMLIEAFANVRNAAIEAWTSTSTAAVQDREIAWLTVKVVDRIKAEIEAVVVTGKIAARRVQAPIR